MTRKDYFKSISLTKDFILLYRLSIFGILFASILFITFSITHEKQKISDELKSTSEIISKLIVYNIDYLRYQLHYASEQLKGDNSYKNIDRTQKILSSYINDINNQSDIAIAWNSFSWINRNNELSIDGRIGIVKEPVDMSNRDYLKITSKNPDKQVFGKPVYGALSKRLIIPIAEGIFINNRQYAGTLVFGLDVEKILDKLEKNISAETYSFVILKDKEQVFASDNFNPENLQKLAVLFEDPQNYETDAEQLSSQDFLSRKKNFIYIKNIKDSPYKVVVFNDKEKTYQRLLNLFMKQIFFICLIIFFCVVFFQSFYERVVKPVSNLSTFALKISKKDFSFRMEKPKSNELATLYDTLNLVKAAFEREQAAIQELRILNTDLSKSNAARDNILRSITHDIKNYIFGICGLARLILAPKSEVEISENKDLQLVENIYTQSDELLHFVNDLLDTNQVESGQLALGKISRCNIRELIDRMMLLSQGLAIKHRVLLKSDIDDFIPDMECDVRRIKQVLINLLTNAIKYSHAGGMVKVSAKYLTDKNKIYLEIADAGIGMNDQDIELVLSGMGKNIVKDDKTIESYGLGMPIVLRLLKLHDAKIEIESKKNVGTKVKLFFNPAKNRVVPEIVQNTSGVHHKNSILLVEDNPVNVKVTSTILRSAGYITSHAENGKEALEILDKKHFDLILMDGEMPVMNGYDTTRNIREGNFFTNFKNFKTIPIVALMSSADEETVLRSKESGMNDHLEKTISRTKLLEVVASYLAK